MLLFFVFSHEFTHYTIYEIYDCEDISWGIETRGVYTTANCENENVYFAQSMNEIVGYNIMPMLILIYLVLVLKKAD